MSGLLARRPSAQAPTADLDVTPVMNMFLILIPFLVSMAAFTHLASHEFSLPADEGPGQAQTATDLPLTVAVGAAGIVVARGDAVLAELPALDGRPDLTGLAAALQGAVAPRLVLAVDDAVGVDVVVACLDAGRAAGFDDVGLARGTGLRLTTEVAP